MKIRTFAIIALGMTAFAVGWSWWLGGRDDATDGHKAKTGTKASATEALAQQASDSTVAAGSSETARRVLPTPVWGPAVMPAEGPGVASVERKVLATAKLQSDAFPDLTAFKKGERVWLPLGDGDGVEGVINLVQKSDDGFLFVSGALAQGAQGRFVLSQGGAGERRGQIHLEAKKLGYLLETKDGEVLLHKKPLGSLLCMGIPRPDNVPAPAPLAGPLAIGTVPQLQSRSSATGVLYLDFDGETSTDPWWNGGNTIFALPATLNGSPISTTQMTDVWQRVAEDYRALNVNVTTMRSVYEAAPPNQRMMCIVTPTTTAQPSAGGVAFLGSYRGTVNGFTGRTPCWAFNESTTAVMAMTISHELGHTLNLDHDGTATREYYAGHGTGIFSWGPIMGAPFSAKIIVFNNGDYAGANNHEDDYAVMNKIVGEGLPSPFVGLTPDDAGDSIATAATFPIVGSVNFTGVLGKGGTVTTSANEVDYYMLRTAGGSFNMTVTPDLTEPNLDVDLQIRDATDAIVAQAPISNTSLAETLSTTLSAGTYYFVVAGKGRPGTTGYSNYGSVGAYTVKGSYVPLPVTPLITVHPLPSTTAVQGSKVTLSVSAMSNSSMSYQWRKNTVAMSGKTSSSLVFTSVQPGDAATYTCDVKNAAGTVTSDPGVLIVNHKPIFTVQPLPAKVTQAEGSTFTLPVTTVAVPSSTTYQWKKNNIDIPGETNATLTISPLQWQHAGSYTCVATNAIGSTTSTASVLTVNAAPFITVQPGLPGAPPRQRPVALNGSATVSVTAIGSAPMTYQWYRGSTLIPGATKSTYSWTKAQLTMEDSYHCVITNAVGTATSDDVQLDVQNPPVVTVNPTPISQTLNKDAAMSLSVTATGTDPLAYQWQLNNVNIGGATSSTLSIPMVTWLDKGVYRCIVTNAVGSATSKTSTLTVISPPVIITPPLATKVARNGTATLKVVAGGTGTLSYQWIKDGLDMPGKTSSSLVLSKVQPATADGQYSVRVTSTLGNVTSTPVPLVVQDVPVVLTQPLSQPVAIGDSLTLNVVMSPTSTPPFTYQWQKNNVNIPGAIGDSLLLTNAQVATTAATYRVIVKNDVGTTTSLGAKISVLTKPAIVTDPAPLTLYEHAKATMSVTASGSATLLYQWRKGGNNLTSASAKTATLVITEALEADEGLYDCVVSNAVGSATSSTAMLTINPVPVPKLSYFLPAKAAVGDRVEIEGANLTWTRSVLVNGKAASFVIRNDKDVRITVPTGATTGVITIQTYGGTITTSALSTDVLTVTSTVPNDDYLNARIVEGSAFITKGSNVAATSEATDLQYDGSQAHSVWFRWVAPSQGRWELNSLGSYFDTCLYVYEGPVAPYPMPELMPKPDIAGFTLLGYAVNAVVGGKERNGAAKLQFQALKGREYWFMLDGDGDPASVTGTKGNYDLRTYYFGLTAPKASDAVESDAAADAKRPEQVAAKLADDDKGASVVSTGASFTIDGTASAGAEQFTWSVYDEESQPTAALLFDTKDGSISALAADGAATATRGRFVADSPSKVEFRLDYTKATWSAMLNGVWIIENQPLTGKAFGDLSATWRSPEGKPTNGALKFSDAWAHPVLPEDAK